MCPRGIASLRAIFVFAEMRVVERNHPEKAGKRVVSCSTSKFLIVSDLCNIAQRGRSLRIRLPLAVKVDPKTDTPLASDRRVNLPNSLYPPVEMLRLSSYGFWCAVNSMERGIFTTSQTRRNATRGAQKVAQWGGPVVQRCTLSRFPANRQPGYGAWSNGLSTWGEPPARNLASAEQERPAQLLGLGEGSGINARSKTADAFQEKGGSR